MKDEKYHKEKELILEIGKTIRKRRIELGYSMEMISKTTGISRGMLGLIESGKSSTSITSIWKLALALNIDFINLIPNLKTNKTKVLKNSERKKIEFEKGKQIYTNTIEDNEDIIMFQIYIKSGIYDNLKWLNNSIKYIAILQRGEASLKIGDTWYDLQEGDCISFIGRLLEKIKIIKTEFIEIVFTAYIVSDK